MPNDIVISAPLGSSTKHKSPSSLEPQANRIMDIPVTFYSYFKDLAGTEQTPIHLPEGSTISDLLDRLYHKYPKLASMERSTLIAVGVEYQDRDYILKAGEEVSLFPPVQGGS
ncbi:MAG: Molybdopterin synthase sulfur carrier subunit [Verrucomicrobia subdivision 3 bacterium]|nr:Molybdopterin synthase sulfur carrier subunit [Limisphaerales bacterium]MCS1417668.1 Molybdopterin synthase sulfur carrier subunit [Limisphaerales bacterium]